MINDVPVPDGLTSFYLFPGSYEVKTTSEYYTFDSLGRFIFEPYAYLSVPTNASMEFGGLGVTLEGSNVFRTAVSEALSGCLAARGTEAGCGLDVPSVLDDGTIVDEGSLVRTADPAVWAELEECYPTLQHDLRFVELKGSLGVVKTTGTGTKDGEPTTFELEVPLDSTVVVDMASPEREVRWY